MPTWLVVIPAYGVKLGNKKEIIEHFDANRDFVTVGLNGGKYVNKTDATRMGLALEVRYGKNLEKLTVLNEKKTRR